MKGTEPRYSGVSSRPLPTWLDRLSDGTLAITRPLDMTDHRAVYAFITSSAAAPKQLRFIRQFAGGCTTVGDATPLAPGRGDVLLLTTTRIGGVATLIGAARYRLCSDRQICESSVSLLDERYYHGMIFLLMQHLVDAARSSGVEQMQLAVMASSAPMSWVMASLGFEQLSEQEASRQIVYQLDLR